MAKETYYFSHDANARQDEKILMLLSEHGWQGYGIYWALVEMMFESSDTKLSHSRIKGISFSYNIDITVLQSVIKTCIEEKLFTSDDVHFWSDSLKKRKEKYHELKTKKSEAGKKGMAKRWSNQGSDNSVITPVTENDNDVITKNNKGKERKVNQSKTNNKTSSQKFSTSDMDNSVLLFKRIQQNNPDVKNPNLEKWANDFRLIREVDNRTDEQIKYLINWTQTDEFWQSNILSPSKLRKQWDQLVVKVKSEGAKKNKQLAIGTSKGSHDWDSVLEELGDE